MEHATKPDVTAEEIAKAQNRWVKFTKLLTWGTVGCIGAMIFLALVTL